MAHGRCNCCFLFWAILSLFTPLQPEKWKCQNKLKNPLRYLHLTQVYQKNDLMLYCSRDATHGRCNCYFSSFAIFCPFTPHNSPENQNFKKPTKQKNNTWKYHFTHVYQKLWLHDVRFLRNGARRTDGRKKWHIKVGVPSRKNQYFEQSATPFGIKEKEL